MFLFFNQLTSKFIVCHGGEFNADNPTLMVELGEFRLHTRENIPDEVFAHIADIRQRETLEEAYNNFEMILSGTNEYLPMFTRLKFDEVVVNPNFLAPNLFVFFRCQSHISERFPRMFQSTRKQFFPASLTQADNYAN